MLLNDASGFLSAARSRRRSVSSRGLASPVREPPEALEPSNDHDDVDAHEYAAWSRAVCRSASADQSDVVTEFDRWTRPEFAGVDPSPTSLEVP